MLRSAEFQKAVVRDISTQSLTKKYLRVVHRLRNLWKAQGKYGGDRTVKIRAGFAEAPEAIGPGFPAAKAIKLRPGCRSHPCQDPEVGSITPDPVDNNAGI